MIELLLVLNIFLILLVLFLLKKVRVLADMVYETQMVQAKGLDSIIGELELVNEKIISRDRDIPDLDY